MNKLSKKLGLTLLVVLAVQTNSFSEEIKGNKTNLHSQTYGKSAPQKLAAGMKAPEFRAKDSKGKEYSLKNFHGKKNILLVFYPGDNTPGCTKQLCNIRDDFSGLEKLNIQIFGINPAGADSHNKFISDYDFQFPLLIDENKKIAADYDAVNMIGFISRTVVLINKEGKIVLYERGMPDMDPDKISKLL